MSNAPRIKLIAATVASIVLVFVYIFPLFRQATPPAQQPLSGLLESASKTYKGNMKGIPISVRGDFLEFPVLYDSQSAWAPISKADKMKIRTYADEISNFTVLVQWPSMQPRKPSNSSSWSSYRSGKASEWISLDAIGDLRAEARPPYREDNGLARITKGRFDDVVRFPQKRVEPDGKPTSVQFTYQLLGVDSALGLEVAATVGRDSTRSGITNNTIYWRGDLNRVVQTLIICPAGKPSKPDLVRTCKHQFEMLELGSYISIYYTENLLPQWETIEKSSRHFISSLRIEPST